MPAQGEASVLFEETSQAIDDHETVGDLHDAPTGLEAWEAEVRGRDAVELPAHLATCPGQPEEAADAAHGLEVADGDKIMETGPGETIPATRGIIRIRSRIFGDPLAIPTERNMQLIGVRRTRAEFFRSAEEERTARVAQLEDPGIPEFCGRT